MQRVKPLPHRRSRLRSQGLRLKFSPYAWAKLLYFRDRGPTEIGGFGIASANDLLFVQDVVLVRQLCSSVSVSFADEAVADHFEEQVDQGRQPNQFARVWLHTHPGRSATPSNVDHETFARVFGGCDWAVMFIIAHGGQTTAELYWRDGQGSVPLEIEIDFSQPFAASQIESWEQEYRANVNRCSALDHRRLPQFPGDAMLADWDELPVEEFAEALIPEPDPFVHHLDGEELD